VLENGRDSTTKMRHWMATYFAKTSKAYFNRTSPEAHPEEAQNKSNRDESFRFSGRLGRLNERPILSRQRTNLFHNVWVLVAVQSRSARLRP
jgi:hypothetical protein